MLNQGRCIRSGALALTLLLSSTVVVLAQTPPCDEMGHPGMQPRPLPPMQTTDPTTNTTTVIVSPTRAFPVASEPFNDPPGTNLLPTIESNAIDSGCDEIPNTLPSTASNPYNLHPDPVVSAIDPRSPTDDLIRMFKRIRLLAFFGFFDGNAVDFALDVLEGNPVPRVYSGMPLLHYKGPERVKKVEPIFAADGVTVIGGNLNVHQVWYDSHIESDTMFVDPSMVQDVPWTITYTIDTLNRGHDDFAPFAIYFDDPQDKLDPNGNTVAGVAMDQTFFPMEDGTRTVYKIAMAPGRYYNLTYHWGWRVHPPRVQVLENALKQAPLQSGKTLPMWEIEVFGPTPTASEAEKLFAISQIGDMAPAKRMWNLLRQMKADFGRAHRNVRDGQSVFGIKINDFNLKHIALDGDSDDIRLLAAQRADDDDDEDEDSGRRRFRPNTALLAMLDDAVQAFFDWQDRTKLPAGVSVDPTRDVTLFYANNTLYGELPGMINDSQVELPQYQTRDTTVTYRIYNGDYYPHGYVNVDFGGNRGWENTFHSTADIGGDGQLFTFGRVYWWINGGGRWGAIVIPPANPGATTGPDDDVPGMHKVDITYNHDPSRRLRIYQFDPFHHDVAIWSMH